MTTTVRLTDAERVDVLLDHVAFLEASRAVAIKDRNRNRQALGKVIAEGDPETVAALRQELELAEATRAELRARVDVLQRDARETRELGRRGLELLAAACRERDEALAKLAVAIAEEEEASRLGKDTLRLMQQMRDERDAALARVARLDRPSATFTAFRLLAVVATTAVVSGAAGAEAVMRWLPW